jgi:fermentation-respiration switch protein FrsA (DUF1100 family)
VGFAWYGPVVSLNLGTGEQDRHERRSTADAIRASAREPSTNTPVELDLSLSRLVNGVTPGVGATPPPPPSTVRSVDLYRRAWYLVAADGVHKPVDAVIGEADASVAAGGSERVEEAASSAAVDADVRVAAVERL